MPIEQLIQIRNELRLRFYYFDLDRCELRDRGDAFRLPKIERELELIEKRIRFFDYQIEQERSHLEQLNEGADAQ